MEQSQRRLNNPKQDIHDIDWTVQKLMNWGGGGGEASEKGPGWN